MDDLLKELMAAGRRYDVYRSLRGWQVRENRRRFVGDPHFKLRTAQAEADRLNLEAMRAVLEPLVEAWRQIEGEPTVYTDCIDTKRVRGIARAALATLTRETSDD